MLFIKDLGYKLSPDWIDNPDLVLVSVVCPLDNFLFVLGLSFTDVEGFSTPASNIEGIFSLEVRISAWNQFPELVFLFIGLAAYNLNSIVVLSFRNFNSHIVLCTKDCKFTITNRSECEFLVRTVVPLVENDWVHGLWVLRDIQNHVTVKSSW